MCMNFFFVGVIGILLIIVLIIFKRLGVWIFNFLWNLFNVKDIKLVWFFFCNSDFEFFLYNFLDFIFMMLVVVVIILFGFEIVSIFSIVFLILFDLKIVLYIFWWVLFIIGVVFFLFG